MGGEGRVQYRYIYVDNERGVRDTLIGIERGLAT